MAIVAAEEEEVAELECRNVQGGRAPHLQQLPIDWNLNQARA